MTEPVKVEPPALRGYAKQLERNADAFDALKKYCEYYCDDAGGLTGLLWATAVPAVNILAEVQYWLLPGAREHLTDTAHNLEAAATRYEQSDQEAAERIWTTRPSWSPPDEPQWVQNDTSHVGDFSDPSAVEPPAPAPNKDMQKKIDKTLGVIDEIDRWLEKVLQISLRKELFPWLTGDWGKVREMAEAYGSLGGDRGVMAIDANLRYGMASLSSSWNGPAAQMFEYHIAGRWHEALTAEAEICKASKEGLEALAVQAEHLYTGLDAGLTAFLLWVVGRVLKAVRLLTRFRFGEAALIVEEIWQAVVTLLDLIETWAKIWPQTVQNVIELGEALYAGAKATISRLSGDLAPMQSG
ncbi:type VII secretion target [Allorhizocola rhizosphaerae]|uniref:type VII secretion target n=1 Tax=Allorhizocola rhizosphaerae TaxID=1872709 RepID=UPI000E3DA286|nr:type VII secretion target [Allorhizocola rhizosphaerae]